MARSGVKKRVLVPGKERAKKNPKSKTQAETPETEEDPKEGPPITSAPRHPVYVEYYKPTPPVRYDRTWRDKATASLKFTPEVQAVFLTHLARTGRWAHSSRAAGISFETVRRHRDQDKIFGDACEAAIQEYRDHIQEAVYEQGVVGIFQPMFDKDGHLVGWKRIVNGTVLLAEARRVNPEYREKTEVDMNLSGGVVVAPATVTPEQWAKMAAEHAASGKATALEAGGDEPDKK